VTNRLQPTPSQTVGPFFAFGLTARQYGYDFDQIAGERIKREGMNETPIRIVGQIFDGAGAPVSDALVEVWQADASGAYPDTSAFADPTAFHGFGRSGTGSRKDGRFAFATIKPGGHDGEAPHLNVILTMRGLLLHVFTRIYFSDEEDANAADPVLALVPEQRRRTLIANRVGEGSYRFDIRMQGDEETVFFDV
jgi:protocatechuate 3,4-dioxygenase, alpha subunit